MEDSQKSKIYNKIIFLIEILISLIIGVSIYKISYKYQDLGNISIPYTIIFILFTVCLLGIIIINTKKYKENVEKMFLTYTIPIGIVLMIILPMNLVPDEGGHMFKIYDLSLGNIITDMGENGRADIYVPKQMADISESYNFNYSTLHQHLQKKADYNDIVAVQTGAKGYFPLNYVSGALVFFIGRIFNINILLACYIIRLINFIIFCTIGYYCIKIIPFGKLLMAIYMFMPMILQQAASLSADTFINSITLLFIAYNLQLLYQNKDLTIIQRIIYYILAFSIAACKYVYFPLVLMSTLLIKNKTISRQNKIKTIIISITVSIIITICWYLFSQRYIDYRSYITEANVNSTEQIKYILTNPFKYSFVLGKTLLEDAAYYLLAFVGLELGPLTIKIPQIIIMIQLFLLGSIPFFEKNENSLTKYQKMILTVIAVIIIVLILTGLYLTWSPVQYSRIAGVQGRYFIPVFILLILPMINANKNINVKNINIKYFTSFFILNILTLIRVYETFIR